MVVLDVWRFWNKLHVIQVLSSFTVKSILDRQNFLISICDILLGY